MTKLQTLREKCKTQNVVSAKLASGVVEYLLRTEVTLRREQGKHNSTMNNKLQALEKECRRLQRENDHLKKLLEEKK